ncbi:hypothetical protein HNY73_019396 [Argiope bruennichi]|uniref:Chromo shadow domain-containing protein n=1 Tax=Argiope bruennichi TaxID=94029 RepID=A0A8T0EHC9_ARGBR|nr:hypothetical protein HNY73_019396 [Argiope bruennichi]
MMDIKTQNNSLPQDNSFLLPKEEYLRRSERIKEIKLRNQNSSCQCASDDATNACVQKKSRIHPSMVFWRNLEQPPNLPLVSNSNEFHLEKEPERVQGLVVVNEKIYVLVKWRHTDAQEYVEKRKCSPEILMLLDEFLNLSPSGERSSSCEEVHIKRETEVSCESLYKSQQLNSMNRIQESSRNEDCLSHIKIE